MRRVELLMVISSAVLIIELYLVAVIREAVGAVETVIDFALGILIVAVWSSITYIVSRLIERSGLKRVGHTMCGE